MGETLPYGKGKWFKTFLKRILILKRILKNSFILKMIYNVLN